MCVWTSACRALTGRCVRCAATSTICRKIRKPVYPRARRGSTGKVQQILGASAANVDRIASLAQLVPAVRRVPIQSTSRHRRHPAMTHARQVSMAKEPVSRAARVNRALRAALRARKARRANRACSRVCFSQATGVPVLPNARLDSTAPPPASARHAAWPIVPSAIRPRRVPYAETQNRSPLTAKRACLPVGRASLHLAPGTRVACASPRPRVGTKTARQAPPLR